MHLLVVQLFGFIAEYPGKKKCLYCGCKFLYDDNEVRGEGRTHLVKCPQCNEDIAVLPKVLILIYSIILVGVLIMMSISTYFIVDISIKTESSICPICEHKNKSNIEYSILCDDADNIVSYNYYKDYPGKLYCSLL